MLLLDIVSTILRMGVGGGEGGGEDRLYESREKKKFNSILRYAESSQVCTHI